MLSPSSKPSRPTGRPGASRSRSRGEAGRTRRVRVGEEGSLRVRFPNARAATARPSSSTRPAAWRAAMPSRSTSGTHRRREPRLTTAAAEKIYRAMDDASRIDVRLACRTPARGSPGCRRRRILFDRTRLERIDRDRPPGRCARRHRGGRGFRPRADGRAGRAAASLNDRWRVRRDGTLAFAETVRLDGRGRRKARASRDRQRRGCARDRAHQPGHRCARPRPFAPPRIKFIGEAGISCWNGLCVARFCAQNSAALRADMARALAALDVVLPGWLSRM